MHFFQEVTSPLTSTTNNTPSSGAVERGRLAVPQPGTNSHHSLTTQEMQLYRRIQNEEGLSLHRSRIVSPPSRRQRTPNTLSAGEYLTPPTRNDTERNTL